jgi:hypothetical protein
MVSKTKFPGICNNCGKKSEFYIRCGIHTLQLCGACVRALRQEIIAITCIKDDEQPEYNNSVETGLIKDIGTVPKTGGVV